MTKRSIASLVLAVIMMAGALVSCASETKTETTKAETEVTTEVAETKDPLYTSDLPADTDFGGATIRMMVDNYKYSYDEFYSDGENGAVINDTVYARNKLIEKELNITLEITRAETSSDSEVGNAIQKSVASGDRLYDICTIPGYRATSYIKGNFRNLIGVENLNLDKGYWTQGFNEIMRCGDKQYLANGAYSISLVRGMYVTLYNEALLAKWKLADPMEMVENGTWTIENLSTMLKDVYVDNDGDTLRDYDDFYGYGGATYSADPYWIAWGFSFLSKNSEGLYTVDIDSDKFSRIVTAYHDFLFNNTGTYCFSTNSWKDEKGNYLSTATGTMFTDRRALMVTVEVNQIELTVAGQFTDDYSIVPLPKLDESQENYYSCSSDRMTCMSIVYTVPENELAMMGAVMEKISEESYKTVFPAFYDQVLTARYLQNAKSKKMLDLLYNGIKIEGSFLYDSYVKTLPDVNKLFSTGESSNYLTSQTKVWSLGADKLNKLFEEME